jgi:hypothetical protein
MKQHHVTGKWLPVWMGVAGVGFSLEARPVLIGSEGSFLAATTGDAVLVQVTATAGYTASKVNNFMIDTGSPDPFFLLRGFVAKGGTASAGPVKVLPTSGDAKDYASGKIDFSYTVGTLFTPDTMSLTFDSYASALTSQLSGINADARVDLQVKVQIPNTSIPGKALIFTIPTLPSLGSTATIHDELTYNDLGGTVFVASRKTGGSVLPSASFTLDPANNYIYTADYTLVVPYGTDPQDLVQLTALLGVGPKVPELESMPVAVGVILLGMATAKRFVRL